VQRFCSVHYPLDASHHYLSNSSLSLRCLWASTFLFSLALVDANMNIVRRYRVNSNDSSNELKSTLPLSSDNTSIFPPVRTGFLRRTDSNNAPPAQPKDPLLSFTLSSPSFLDSTVQEASSRYPLYRIKTSGTSTTILRRDREAHATIVVASIKWPKIIPLKRGKSCSEAVLVMINNGRWSGGDAILKPGSKER